MRAAVIALAALLLAAPAAAAQTWSPPQTLSGGESFVDDALLAFSRDGRGLASWSFFEGIGNTARGGASVASRPPGGDAFGPARALIEPSRRTGARLGPFAYGLNGALAAVEGERRLRVRFGHTDGTFGKRRTVRTLDAGRFGDSALAVNDEGAAALAWFEDRGTSSDRVYVSLRRPGHAFGAPRRLATGAIRRVAVAIGATGDVLVVWNSPGKNLTRFKPRGRSSFRPVDKLRSRPAFFTDLRPVVTSSGRAAVAWSSQFASEGGESGPAHFQVAVRPYGAERFRPARLLEELGPEAQDRAIDAVEGDTGRIAVAWSGTDGSNRRVKVAQFDAGLRFQPAQLVSPAGADAYFSDLAAANGNGNGRLVALWDGGVDTTASAVGAAVSGGGGAPFGPPEAVTAGGDARGGVAAFDPRTQQPTVVFSDQPDRGTVLARASTRLND
jgi:hypothetical protein